MEYIVLIVLLYMGIKHLLQVVDIVYMWISKYRDDKQAIAKVNAWCAVKDEYPDFTAFMDYYNKRGN